MVYLHLMVLGIIVEKLAKCMLEMNILTLIQCQIYIHYPSGICKLLFCWNSNRQNKKHC